MSQDPQPAAAGKPLVMGRRAERRPVQLSAESLVHSEPLLPGARLPLLVRPASAVDLASWAASQRSWVEERLHEHGAVLFRGFPVTDVARFQEVVSALCGDLLEYRERSSPRHAVADRVYTSTDYPADHPIFLHNENSYQKAWPLRIFFHCDTPPETRGETPLADVRRVLARIPPEVRERFAQQGWMYVRNFGDGLGLPWQTVFQTEDRATVEDYCREAGIQVEWKEGNRLRTRAVRRALARHPRTRELVWFNHATFFHVSTLVPEVRDSLLNEFGEEDLPANTYYGDGAPIEPEVLEALRDAYRQETVEFPWQRGDVLMVDNMLVAHGRAPYSGPRKIVVAMAEPIGWQDLEDL